MKKVNQYIYLLIYALHKITGDWLKEVNDTIKNADNIHNVISSNEDNNIYIEQAKAPAKYSKEDQAKIDELKATMTPINLDEKVLKIKIRHITKGTQSKVDTILNILENSQDNKVIQRVASMIKTQR